jgi:diguanylate cyclase (GGDEF)-like protein/PAS domain S-box-containing protein
MRNLLAAPAERVFFKDLQSRFVLVSEGCRLDLGGRPLCEVLGKTDFDIFSSEHAAAALEDEQRVICTGEPVVGKLERESFDDGRPDVWVSTTKMPLRDGRGRTIGTFGMSRDVTAQVRAEQALAHQALKDPLTGLANRLALTDRLSQALVSLERAPGRVGLLLIDLDNFKRVNDSFGHEEGDRVLVEAARRLGQVCRRGDTVARLGGDEFVLLCPALHDDDISLVASRAVRAIGKTLTYQGKDLTVTGSIGAVVTSDPSADPDALLQKADMAMYEAKAGGRDGFRIFDADMRARALAGQALEAELRRALEGRELFLVYQPLFSLEDRALRGVEALVRWQHPERGALLAEDFVPLAEERGLVGAIDAFALDQACRQLADWASEEACPEGFTVAVNLSGRQLSDPTTVERVSSVIGRYGIAPSQLCLEFTENALVGEAAGSLAGLSRLGVKLAFDDLGTGYSTLAHLQRLEVDILKIDRSFVHQVGLDGRGHEIVAAVAAMAHALGMTVVAEGIETDAQLGRLEALGCDAGQGFLLARPLPADQVSDYLARSSPQPRLPAPRAVSGAPPDLHEDASLASSTEGESILAPMAIGTGRVLTDGEGFVSQSW